MSAKDIMQNITTEELPDILTAKHISEHLHVSKRRAYELLQISPSGGGIKSFTFGRSVRARKEDYLKWLDALNGNCLTLAANANYLTKRKER